MKIDKDFNLIIGLRIRELRESLGLSREAFSEKCDLSSSFLAAVENGTKGITAKPYIKYATQPIFLLITLSTDMNTALKPISSLSIFLISMSPIANMLFVF